METKTKKTCKERFDNPSFGGYIPTQMKTRIINAKHMFYALGWASLFWAIAWFHVNDVREETKRLEIKLKFENQSER